MIAQSVKRTGLAHSRVGLAGQVERNLPPTFLVTSMNSEKKVYYVDDAIYMLIFHSSWLELRRISFTMVL